MKRYKHLSEEERNHLVVLINRGESIRAIAQSLGRSPSSISREIKRNYGKTRYRAHCAHDRARHRHHSAHKRDRLKTHALRIEVEAMLNNGWSPELIAGYVQYRPDLPSISHEAIYQWIYADAPHLIGSLVRAHPARWPKGTTKRCKRMSIPQRVPLDLRPAAANKRTQAGHWEADLMVGKGRSAIQVMVERKTRLARLLKIPDKTAASSRAALAAILRQIPQPLRRSITYDNGSENYDHSLVNAEFATSSFFCQPYHAWEKGSIENTNGLVRRFLPKNTNFDTIPDTTIKKVESWLNNRPRKCLNFKTPAESFISACCT